MTARAEPTARYAPAPAPRRLSLSQLADSADAVRRWLREGRVVELTEQGVVVGRVEQVQGR